MNDTAPPQVLLVDDEAALREPLAEYLSRQGFAVTQAISAAEARSRLRDMRPDLVLLDIMMPGEDGLSLCRHLVESQDVPVIFLTARGEATDRIVGLEIGADDYVVKPFEPRELVARIRSVLQREPWWPSPRSNSGCSWRSSSTHARCSTATACLTWFKAAKRICSIVPSIIRSAACAARSRSTAATHS